MMCHKWRKDICPLSNAEAWIKPRLPSSFDKHFLQIYDFFFQYLAIQIRGTLAFERKTNPPVGILLPRHEKMKTHLRKGIVFSSFFAILNKFLSFQFFGYQIKCVSQRYPPVALVRKLPACTHACILASFSREAGIDRRILAHNLMLLNFRVRASDFSSFRKRNFKKTSRHWQYFLFDVARILKHSASWLLLRVSNELIWKMTMGCSALPASTTVTC